MFPFDKISSRDIASFPFEEFLKYPRLFMVDWREAESDLVAAFLGAAGLPPGDTTWHWNEANKSGAFVSHGRSHPVSAGQGFSAQHTAVKVLQGIYSGSHEIRYMNHVAPGDTAYLVVESPDSWKELEAANPLVCWFFTPLEYTHDIFQDAYEALAEAGRRFAEGQTQRLELAAYKDPTSREFLVHCRTRLDAERARSETVPSAARLRMPAPLAQLTGHPLRVIYDEQPLLFKHGQVVWAHVVQANNKLYEFGEEELPAALVFSTDPWFDGNPQFLAEVATNLFAQKGTPDPDPVLAEFARIISSETEMVFNLPVPRQRTGDRDVLFTTTMVHRNHLPDWMLKGVRVPFLVAPAHTRASMILPHRYWPYKLWK